MVKKISSEVLKNDVNQQMLTGALSPQIIDLIRGDVEIMKSATIQVKEFHPVTTSISIRLPIEADETAKQAIRRVRQIVEEELTDAVGDVINDRLSKYEESARLKNADELKKIARKLRS